MKLIGQAITPGGGGGGLNFKIVGGTTEPTSPKENTIWVNTGNKISNWIFSSSDPLLDTHNLYNSDNIKNNVHLKENGAETGYSSYMVADITLPEGAMDVQITMGDASTTSAYHAFFDASGNFISSMVREPGTNTYSVPDNAKTLRISVYKSSDTTPRVEATISSDAYENVVWVQIGTSSPVAFNALKKNGIQVYPISAKQYVSGEWVNKDAKSYQSGAWVDWVTNLYNSGTDFTDITGGWEEKGFPYTSGTGGNTGTLAPTITWGDNRFIYNGTGNHDSYTRGGRLFTVNNIDLTDMKTIRFHILSSTVVKSGNTHCWIGVFNRNGSHMGENKIATVEVETETAEKWYDVDVSALSGGYAVGIEASSQSKSTVELIVDMIYMTR